MESVLFLWKYLSLGSLKNGVFGTGEVIVGVFFFPDEKHLSLRFVGFQETNSKVYTPWSLNSPFRV